MKKKVIMPALFLPGILMTALVMSTGTTVYGKGGNEVNVGEADSHLKVHSAKDSQTAKSEAAAVDKPAQKRQPGKLTDEDLQRLHQPHDELVPAAQGDGDPTLPQNMQRKKDDNPTPKPSDIKS